MKRRTIGILTLCAVLALLVLEPHMSGIVLTTAIVGTILLLGGSGLFLLVFQHGLLVVGGCLALFKGDGTGGASGQAVAKAVAVIVPDQLCFSVYDGDRALVARLRTQAAARAGRLVDFDDRPFHVCPSCCFWASNLARRSASAFS